MNHWPTQLLSFVQSRGADVVWKKGLALYGYPPTLADTVEEFVSIAKALG
jgi:malate/lactate dehydrogenase